MPSFKEIANTPKICIETQKSQIAKVILKKKYRAEGLRLPDYRLDYETTGIKIVWYWHKNRNINQWNRIENPELSP